MSSNRNVREYAHARAAGVLWERVPKDVRDALQKKAAMGLYHCDFGIDKLSDAVRAVMSCEGLGVQYLFTKDHKNPEGPEIHTGWRVVWGSAEEIATAAMFEQVDPDRKPGPRSTESIAPDPKRKPEVK